MLGCTNLSEELDCALEIFPMYLQSQCVGMPSLVLRAILRLTERPDTVSRGQPGDSSPGWSDGRWVTRRLRLFPASGVVLAAASSPASSALCPVAVPCKETDSSAEGNGLPLPARPRRDAGARVWGLQAWPWGAEPRGETQRPRRGLLAARAALQAAPVAHQPAQGSGGEGGSRGAGKEPALSVLPLCALLFPWPCR